MFYPNFEEFQIKTTEGNLIPVYKRMDAGNHTPLSIYQALEKASSFLFESKNQDGDEGRYAYVGMGAEQIFSPTGLDPLAQLKKRLLDVKPVPTDNLPYFWGGYVGFIGYDIVKTIEDIEEPIEKDSLPMPEMFLMIANTVIIFDSLKNEVTIVSNAHIQNSPPIDSYKQACSKITDIINRLTHPPTRNNTIRKESEIAGIRGDLKGDFQSRIQSNFPTKESFEEAVDKAKEYIRNGDIFQVVLSQRFAAQTHAHPLDIYKNLCEINPSPYMFYLNTGKTILIGSSPEILVRTREKKLELRPIAGTRKRGENHNEDLLLKKSLQADAKEKAEHIMLVDLARNDAGRVSRANTVTVFDLMDVEYYSHVMHMTTKVTGILSEENDAIDTLKACFPAGTVSGAPKVRAMEIIEELEPSRRGPYAGSVGYIGFSGDMDMCITIRTIIMDGENAYVQAGAGIVADSIPENEYFETVNKAKGMLKAVELATVKALPRA